MTCDRSGSLSVHLCSHVILCLAIKMYIYEYICEEQWPKQMQRASFALAASDPEPKEMFELCSKNL